MYFQWLICRQELNWGAWLWSQSASLTLLCVTSRSLQDSKFAELHLLFLPWLWCVSPLQQKLPSLDPPSWKLALLQQHQQPCGVGNWLLQLPGDPGAVQPVPIPGKTASCLYLVVRLPWPAVHAFRWACAGSPECEGQCPSALSYVQLRLYTQPVPAKWRNSSRLARSLKTWTLAGDVWDGRAGGFDCSHVAHILFNNFL